MDYPVNYGEQVFVVPAAVTDHFLRLASPDALRVLLLYLRYAQSDISAEEIAVTLQLPLETVDDALTFWTQANVLKPGGSNILRFSSPCSIPAVPTVPVVPAMAEGPAETPAPPSLKEPALAPHVLEKRVDPSTIAAALEASPALRSFYSLVERAVGRPLNHSEQERLYLLNADLNMPTEVILTLVNYCASIEKYSIAYVASIAMAWHDAGINDLESAEEEIQRMTEAHSYVSEIRRIFDMQRKPTTKQMEYIEKWKAAGTPMPILQYAYERTVEAIEKCDFKYIDKIVTDLAEKGITDPAEADRAREKGGKKPKSSRRRPSAPLTEAEVQKKNSYLSVVNRFKKEDDTDE